MRKATSHQQTFMVKRQRKLERRARCQRLRTAKLEARRLARYLQRAELEITDLRVEAPRVFSVVNGRHRNGVIHFLRQLRWAFHQRTLPVLIDFRNVERLQADGMLLFFAEIHRLVHNFNHVQVTIRVAECVAGEPSKKAKVTEVLSHLGILSLLRNPLCVTSDASDVVNWQAVTGGTVDMELVEPTLLTLDDYISRQSTDSLNIGISEAMNNAVEHAYVSRRPDGLGLHDTNRRHWYLFSRVGQIEGREVVTVVFCDLGVGIPVTLPNTNPDWIQVLGRALMQDKSDGAAIQHAIKKGRTRTGETHRGRGLPQLLENVEKIPGSTLTILSNRGAYNYVDGRSWVPKDFSDSILGTLIAWTFPIDPPDSQGAERG